MELDDELWRFFFPKKERDAVIFPVFFGVCSVLFFSLKTNI